jgi:tRNA pseudouridine13 synthase
LGDGLGFHVSRPRFFARTPVVKLKQQPDDFRVEELTDVTPGERGDFAFYRLEKSGVTTTDALDVICRRWRIDARRVAFGGLKDRHAATIQYLTIVRGPRRGLSQQHLNVRYLGQIGQSYSSDGIRANRFEVTLRDFSAADAVRVVNAVEEVRRDGVANYFDAQRFGSVAADGVFIGKQMVLGDYEGALKLALTDPYEFDRAEQRGTKRMLRECWGHWAACKDGLPPGHDRDLVMYLLHRPADFRGAVGRLRPELQGMYLAAYQSHLWNRILAVWMEASLRAGQRLMIETKLGPLPMPRGLNDDQGSRLAATTITLPAARSPFDGAAPWAAAAERVLGDEGLAWSDLKLRGLRKPFFARGERAALIFPDDISAAALDDDRHAGRQAVRLTFTLPRGSYATMVVKRLTAQPPQ